MPHGRTLACATLGDGDGPGRDRDVAISREHGDCGGRLRASYGQESAQVSGFDQSGGNATGDMWRVVDVTSVVSNSETTDCALAPLHPPGMSSGYWVSTTPRTY